MAVLPQRICPKCGADDEIAADAPLWPADWRCPACGFENAKRNGLVQLAPELDDFDEGFGLASYDVLRVIEHDHFWFTTRNEMIAWLVQRFAPRAGRALEIGCGTGYVLFALRDALPGARLSGSELHSLGLAHARQRHGQSIELFQMDARRSGVNDALDLVGAFDVLEHIADDERVLGEIYNMLKPGGVLIATVPQHPWLWSSVDEIAHHQRRYKVGELARKASGAGFSVRYRSSFATFALPLMVAVRLKPRRERSGDNADGRVGSTINALLTALFRLEQALRRTGFPLPFGGSGVLVAQKPHTQRNA